MINSKLYIIIIIKLILLIFRNNIHNFLKINMDEEKKANDQGGFLIRKSTMIRKNDKPIDDVYKISKKPLGTGAYGVVSACIHRDTNQERACKKVPKKKIKNMDRFK